MSCQPEIRSWNWETSHISHQIINDPKLVCWFPPPMGVLKLNVDASTNGVAAAFIIRDHQRNLLRAGGKVLPPSSIPYAEIVAAWLGLKVVWFEMHAWKL